MKIGQRIIFNKLISTFGVLAICIYYQFLTSQVNFKSNKI